MTRHTILFVLGLCCAGAIFANEVTDWNKVMISATLTAPATPAPVATRAAAIVQTAVFDAVNGIDRVLSRNSNVLKTMRMAGVCEMARDTVDEWAF